VGYLGLYCLLTALCGLVGVTRDRRAHLSAFIALLALLVLGQAGATLLLLTDNSWRGRIPGEPAWGSDFMGLSLVGMWYGPSWLCERMRLPL
jgi:hypothetical protein